MNARKSSHALMSILTLATFAFGLTVRAQAQAPLYNFPGGWIGGLPQSTLTLDPSGNLYGTTFIGGGNPAVCDQPGSSCGTVFKLSQSSGGNWTETVLRGFTGGTRGGRLVKGLARDAAGNLYGTTSDGGDLTSCTSDSYLGPGCGVVFELSPTSSGQWAETILHTFSGGTDGASPASNLIIDSAENLYGTTYFGGNLSVCAKMGCGVAFRLSKTASGWHETVLRSFDPKVDGFFANGLVQDSAGNLYGTTYEVGGTSCGCGTVFRLAPTASGPWTETVLYAFAGGTDGASPEGGGVVLDGAGNLYGTTTLGGAHGSGSIYELSPSSSGSWTETQLYNFTGGLDGKYPKSDLVFDAAGDLYGSTPYGGSTAFCNQGCGVIFELSPSGTGTWTQSVLGTFEFTNGEQPNGVIIDSAGNLYGSAGGGTASDGVVYEIRQ